MVSRRSLLVGGGGVVALGGVVLSETGHLDDVLRAVGARPKDRPDEGDVRLASVARAETDALIELTDGDTPRTVRDALNAQAAGLPDTTRTATLEGTLVEACRSAAAARAADAADALSPDLSVVLASLAAGLDQIVRTLESRR